MSTLARRLTIPIIQLTETAEKMAGGDLEVSLPLSGVRELQSLSDSLDRLRHGLKKRLKEGETEAFAGIGNIDNADVIIAEKNRAFLIFFIGSPRYNRGSSNQYAAMRLT